MRIVATLETLRRVGSPVIMAAGFFDGVHRGHQKVLGATLAAAPPADGQAWILTFSDHPMQVLGQGAPPRLLTSTRHRLRLFEQMGFDGCVLLPFTRRLARLAPEAFVQTLCRAAPSLAEIHVGSNWRFGCGGVGDTALLKRLGTEAGFTVSTVRPVRRKGRVISSTRIRREIEKGHLEEAAAMLARPFSLLGAVQRGRTVGRMLGVPTANLDVENEILPPRGDT